MSQVFFHVEVETDVLEDEWDEANPGQPMPTSEQLERQAVEFVANLFEREVSTHGRRHDGALICSFATYNLARVLRIIRDNAITEGNDQITAGVEYVIVRDFEIRD